MEGCVVTWFRLCDMCRVLMVIGEATRKALTSQQLFQPPRSSKIDTSRYFASAENGLSELVCMAPTRNHQKFRLVIQDNSYIHRRNVLLDKVRPSST